MNNKINASEIQRKGLKRVYEQIDKYESFVIENNRQNFTIYLTKYKNNLGQIIQILREEKILLNEIGLTSLFVFGSLATGKASSNSDVDLAFDIKDKEHVGLKGVIKITENIKAILKDKIMNLDVHYLGMLKNDIKHDVFQKGVNVF